MSIPNDLKKSTLPTILFFLITLISSFVYANPNLQGISDVNKKEIITIQADEDGDGIEDNVDTCPQTPAGESVDANGCSASQLDDDNDGVANSVDTCPDTPAGTTVDASGCAVVVDQDLDGVEDSIDQCPDTPLGDPVDENGCGQTQLDDDNDGVFNFFDICPETPCLEQSIKI